MKQQIVSLLLLSMASFGATSAWSDEWDSTTYPDERGHYDDYERGRIDRRVDPSTGDLIITARLNHLVRGAQVLDLERLLALESSSVRGRELQKVAIEADARYSMASAQLLVNGMARDGVRRIDRINDREIFTLSGRNLMGIDVRSLQLALRGDLALTKVAVRLSRSSFGDGRDDHDGRGRVIHRLVSQHVNGSEVLRLREILDLGSEDTGLDVERITIMGNSTDAYRALRVQLMINGRAVGAPKLLTRGSVSFVIPEYRDDIGSDIRTLRVVVQGRGYVHAVSAVVEREFSDHDGSDGWIIGL